MDPSISHGLINFRECPTRVCNKIITPISVMIHPVYNKCWAVAKISLQNPYTYGITLLKGKRANICLLDGEMVSLEVYSTQNFASA